MRGKRKEGTLTDGVYKSRRVIPELSLLLVFPFYFYRLCGQSFRIILVILYDYLI